MVEGPVKSCEQLFDQDQVHFQLSIMDLNLNRDYSHSTYLGLLQFLAGNFLVLLNCWD